MDPVYDNLSNGHAGIRVTIGRREAFGRIMNCFKRNPYSQGMKSFIGSSIRILFRTDMKSYIPDSEYLLWIWRSPCTELNVPPWMITFEGLKSAILQLVTCSKWGGERKTDRKSIPRVSHGTAMHSNAQSLNKPLITANNLICNSPIQ